MISKLFLALIIAYLLGSIPSALLYSRVFHHQDIRTLGDGNMGARNSKRSFGWRGGILVALADILKGLVAVVVADEFGLLLPGQMACGAAAILGHDFPVLARFRGGQGFAVTTGVFLGLFPLFTLVGAAIYFALFFLTRNSDLAAGIGMGLIFLAEIVSGAPFYVIVYIVAMLLFIPFKKWLDRSRQAAIDANLHGRHGNKPAAG
jgi:glycerol-3-phosphate acyltransferase PlsY